MKILKVILSLTAILLLSCAETVPPEVQTHFHAQGEMAGEVTQTSVILQSRLTAADSAVDGDVPGITGVACFEISTERDFPHYLRTGWIDALPENDFIVKTKVSPLKPGTTYYYRLIYGTDSEQTLTGDICTFATLPGIDEAPEMSFVVVTGMNYSFFHHGRGNKPETAYQGSDRHQGYPAIETITAMKPDFFVGTGDNVYYDHPVGTRAKTVADMRRKWHEQFVQDRFKRLFSSVPTYWEKDDHDYRYNDADRTDVTDGPKPDGADRPTHDEGIALFREQAPVVDPAESNPVTYRTHRLNKLLQIWLVEGRDYRSPNAMPDGPEKTLWGSEQEDWLKSTLLESDAAFKLLISPTPMVGPDDAYKTDNHVNHQGFRHEGDEFFRWLAENGFRDKNFFIVCGDRHWQYHSMHPTGFEEFSSGALVDANSRLGRKPGDPKSTDPDALVQQIYTQAEPSGGFLRITVKPEGDEAGSACEFAFFDENGTELYSTVKIAQ